jgi:hypothetical protein
VLSSLRLVACVVGAAAVSSAAVLAGACVVIVSCVAGIADAASGVAAASAGVTAAATASAETVEDRATVRAALAGDALEDVDDLKDGCRIAAGAPDQAPRIEPARAAAAPEALRRDAAEDGATSLGLEAGEDRLPARPEDARSASDDLAAFTAGVERRRVLGRGHFLRRRGLGGGVDLVRGPLERSAATTSVEHEHDGSEHGERGEKTTRAALGGAFPKHGARH